MERPKHMVAFDCSNTSIRTILGRYDGEKVEYQVVAREPNEPIRVQGRDYWNILAIFRQIQEGLVKALAMAPAIDSIGVCTWGLDFSFLSRDGILLGDPLTYRNELGSGILEKLDRETRWKLFQDTGILCDKINTLFLLKALREQLPYGEGPGVRFLMIPDLLNYMLTGVARNEPSEFSTSQLMDIRDQRPSETACRFAGFRPDWLSPLGQHGKLIGLLSQEIKTRLGIDYDIPVVCVPSHDTAAAILSAPTEEPDFAFISSGTWALIGTELQSPVITLEAEAAGFTNELGAFGRITLLKNNSGMYILQRLREEQDREMDWDTVVRRGQTSGMTGPLFDVNHGSLFHPGSMRQALWQLLRETGQVGDIPFDFDTAVTAFHLSMACSYRAAIRRLERVTGKRLREIVILGGGIQNTRLCQLAANLTGKRILTGSAESTSLGALMAQIKWFQPEKSVEDLRRIAVASVEIKEYLPQTDGKPLWVRYRREIERRERD